MCQLKFNACKNRTSQQEFQRNLSIFESDSDGCRTEIDDSEAYFENLQHDIFNATSLKKDLIDFPRLWKRAYAEGGIGAYKKPQHRKKKSSKTEKPKKNSIKPKKACKTVKTDTFSQLLRPSSIRYGGDKWSMNTVISLLYL